MKLSLLASLCVSRTPVTRQSDTSSPAPYLLGQEGGSRVVERGSQHTASKHCTVLCYTCLYSEKETQGPARLRPGKKGGREGRSRC